MKFPTIHLPTQLTTHHNSNKKDALGVYDTDSLAIITEEPSRFLIIDVPMS